MRPRGKRGKMDKRLIMHTTPLVSLPQMIEHDQLVKAMRAGDCFIRFQEQVGKNPRSHTHMDSTTLYLSPSLLRPHSSTIEEQTITTQGQFVESFPLSSHSNCLVFLGCSKKQRIPAWCDRVLWRDNSRDGKTGIVPVSYRRHEQLESDHRFCIFSLFLSLSLNVVKLLNALMPPYCFAGPCPRCCK